MHNGFLRFSLRTLLLVPVVLAVLSYFAMLPSIKARRFVNAVRNGQPEVARKMLKNSALNYTHQAVIQGKYPVSIERLSLSSLVNGRTTVYAVIAPSNVGSGVVFSTWIRFTRYGIEVSAKPG